MKNSYDQLKIDYSETDKESKSVRLISIFLILIFVLVPLAEIVVDIDYNTITSYPSFNCFSGLDYPFEILSFKEIK